MYSTNGWNIFARELEEILYQHGRTIADLDRLIGLHPQLVSRLRRSLISIKPLVILNPESLELLHSQLALTDAEMQRLQAAALATSVERLLIDRIETSKAFFASEQVFHILLQNWGPGLASTVR